MQDVLNLNQNQSNNFDNLKNFTSLDIALNDQDLEDNDPLNLNPKTPIAENLFPKNNNFSYQNLSQQTSDVQKNNQSKIHQENFDLPQDNKFSNNNFLEQNPVLTHDHQNLINENHQNYLNDIKENYPQNIVSQYEPPASRLLLQDHVISQSKNSIQKLIDTKSMVNGIANFMQSPYPIEIAVQLMEPKLEKWMNENLAQIVEKIVKEEISKITPK
jgi:cell pole-organizing protein PopZ